MVFNTVTGNTFFVKVVNIETKIMNTYKRILSSFEKLASLIGMQYRYRLFFLGGRDVISLLEELLDEINKIKEKIKQLEINGYDFFDSIKNVKKIEYCRDLIKDISFVLNNFIKSVDAWILNSWEDEFIINIFGKLAGIDIDRVKIVMAVDVESESIKLSILKDILKEIKF